MIVACKGFTFKRVDGKLYIESGLQTFVLRGINNNTKHLQYITEHIKPTSTMTELVGLFYTRDDDGYAEQQLVEMHPVRREQPQ
jgi:hypothetical protein